MREAGVVSCNDLGTFTFSLTTTVAVIKSSGVDSSTTCFPMMERIYFLDE